MVLSKKILFSFFILLMCVDAATQNSTLENELAKRIYIKQHISKSIVTVGEPISVTYELYSALPSKTEIMEQPDYKGFSISEIINPSHQIFRFVEINNTRFTVHTFKKLILTPIDTGKLIIDSFRILNKVNLQDHNGNLLPWIKQTPTSINFTTDGWYDFPTRTQPIFIEVLPATTLNSTQFDGVTGDFKIEVFSANDSVTVGSTNHITISFSGTGEFDKIKLPFIDFGNNIIIKDTLIHQKTDSIFYADTTLVTGYKQFVLPIIFLKAGTYIIPKFDFSFYNPMHKQLITIGTPTSTIAVYSKVVTLQNSEASDNSSIISDKNILLILGVVLFFLLAAILVVLRSKKKKKITVLQNPIDSIYQYLSIAQTEIYGIDQMFYTQLKKALLATIQYLYDIEDVKNQQLLKSSLLAKGLSYQQTELTVQQLISIETNLHHSNIDHQFRKKLFLEVDALIKNLLSK